MSECLWCHYPIKQVAGLWIHQDRRAYEYPRHIAEPLERTAAAPYSSTHTEGRESWTISS